VEKWSYRHGRLLDTSETEAGRFASQPESLELGLTEKGNAKEELTLPSNNAQLNGPKVMPEKRNQDQFSNERRTETPEEAPSKGRLEPAAPIDKESFAQRAGQIIARAVRGAAPPVKPKRK
jgi:hypothetical protein